MKPNHELEHELETLGQSVAPGPSIADEVMRRIRQQAAGAKPTTRQARYPIVRARKLKLAAAGAAAAAAVLLTVQLWPDASPNGIVWADVLKQIRSAHTAHLRIRMNDPQAAGGKRATVDWYLKTPGMMRQDYHIEGVKPRTAIVSNGRGVMLVPSRKLAYQLPPWETSSVDEDAIEKMLIQFLPFTTGQAPEQAGDVEGFFGGGAGKLVLRAVEHRDDRKLE